MSEAGSRDVRRQIEEAFQEAGMPDISDAMYGQLAQYLALLVRWNARLNLTSVRSVGEMIRTHFVECAVAARHLPEDVVSLLDYGSGAGFPGMVIAACCPQVHVTLAEANTKKAAFLREVVRTSRIGAEIFNGRVDSLDSGRLFDAVSMRAVEQMEEAIPAALHRAQKYLVILATAQSAPGFTRVGSVLHWFAPIPLPNAVQRVILIGRQPQPSPGQPSR